MVQPNLQRLRAKTRNLSSRNNRPPMASAWRDRVSQLTGQQCSIGARGRLTETLADDSFYGAGLAILVLLSTEGSPVGRTCLALVGYLIGKAAGRLLLGLLRWMRNSIERRPYVWMVVGLALIWIGSG